LKETSTKISGHVRQELSQLVLWRSSTAYNACTRNS